METIRVKSEDFISLIDAALVTVQKPGKDADPALSSILLDTVVAEERDRPEEVQQDYGVGDVPGKPDLRNYLVATTSDLNVVGQVSVLADGTFTNPLLLDQSHLSAAKAYVRASMRAGKTAYGSEATFHVEMTLIESASGGMALSLQTLTNGRPEDNDSTSTVTVTEAGSYPDVTVFGMLEGKSVSTLKDDEGNEIPHASGVMGFDESQIRVMRDISSKLGGGVLQFVRGHDAHRRILTCANMWRGSVPGFPSVPTEDTDPNVAMLR